MSNNLNDPNNNLNVSNEEIIFTVKNIMHDSKILNNKDIEKKYEKFKSSFEKLYEKSINSVLNDTTEEFLDMLSHMLSTRVELQNNTKPKVCVDMYIGNKLGEKYIYPYTSTPSNDDFKQAFEKISNIVESDKKEEEENLNGLSKYDGLVSEEEYCDRGYEY